MGDIKGWPNTEMFIVFDDATRKRNFCDFMSVC